MKGRIAGLTLLGCAVSCAAGWLCFHGVGSLMHLSPVDLGIKGPFGFLPSLALYGLSFMAAFGISAWILQRLAPLEARLGPARLSMMAVGAGAALCGVYVILFLSTRLGVGPFLLERPWLPMAGWVLAWNGWFAWRAGRVKP